MKSLKVLPSQIANMIAAGEVVLRPASVVKELMENAIDAGATQVNVIVTDSGRSLVQVIDNGVGMSPSDAVLCFERHATSKIATAEDLQEILSYGFRGEALASIAAVSEITLKTRRAGDETATQVRISAGAQAKTSSVSAPVGSSFAVRDLFYNTPARRKFLKSDTVELKHIVEEFTRIAITRPEVAFTLSSNGKEMFSLKSAKSLKYRIQDLLGAAVIGELVDVRGESSIIKVSGFVGKPDSARKTLGKQYFFVNGRYFRSPYLHKAVMKAYEEMIPEGYTPSYFIFLEIDPKSIDVNIHPTKAEIKFEDDSLVFQILSAMVRETLGRNSFGASIDFDTENAPVIPELGRNFSEYRGLSTPTPTFNPEFNPFDSPSEVQTPSKPAGGFPSYPQMPEKKEDYSRLFEDVPMQKEYNLLIVKGKYILYPVASGVMVVNVPRARERILYDKYLNALAADEPVSQVALFPVHIELGVEQCLLLSEHSELLSKLGFDIVIEGQDAVTVNAVPESYNQDSGRIEAMIGDILYILSEEGSSLPEIMRQRLAQRFATLGASNAVSLVTKAEAQQLIDTLFASEHAELTASGRKIVSIMSVEDIEKMF